MAVVEVTGLPNSVKMPKLVYSFRDILKFVDVKNFWIVELADMRNCDLKEVKIEFLTYEDARRASTKLDNYIFFHSGEESPLMAKILKEKVSGGSRSRHPPPRRQSRNENYGRHSRRYSPKRDRSRSPVYTESSKLDLEIELLRKQRMVIEEERRLLLERKKLELIKEFGPSATKEFEHMERSRERERRLRPSKVERPVRKPSPSRVRPRPAGNPYSLPQFIVPCKILLNQMKFIIKEKANMGEKTALHKLLRSQLRRRIALCLEDKNYMPAEEIVKLYRESHPISSDEELVETVLNNLRLSHWSVKYGGEVMEEESEKPNKEGKELPKKITKKKENNSGTSSDTTADVIEEINDDISIVEPMLPELKEPTPESKPAAELKPEPKESILESKPEPRESILEPIESVPESKPESMDSVPETEEIDMVKEPAESVQNPEPVQSVLEPEQPAPKPIQPIPIPVKPVPKPIQLVPKPVPKPVQLTPKPEVKEIVDNVIEDCDLTFELTVDGPDDDWIEDGIDWNDDEEDDQDQKEEI